MKVKFNIHYNTVWGQRIALLGNTKRLGNEKVKEAVFMQHVKNGNWELIIDLAASKTPLSYQYFLLNDSKEVLEEEFGENRIINLATQKVNTLNIFDNWRSTKEDSTALYTSAFSEAILQQSESKIKNYVVRKSARSIQFRLYAPRIEAHQQLVICGNIPALGNWNLGTPLFLENSNYPLWTTSNIEIENYFEIQYKYGIFDKNENRIIYLEQGENRVIHSHKLPLKGEKSIFTDLQFRHPQGAWKGTGVAVPVFSLRSEKGLGIGEFTDIKLLVDWAKENSLKMIQILPVNDTNATKTWTDSYPYAAISVFALHPMYLNLEKIVGFKKAIKLADYEKEQIRLNILPEVDYEEVMLLKMKWVDAIFEKRKKTFLKEEAFKTFMGQNKNWLKPYAAFCYLRDKNGTADFTKWSNHTVFNPTSVAKLTSEKAKDFDKIAFWYFIQYELDKQLSEAGNYARNNGIILKGDIPIGIYRHSVDAWTAPELYNMNGQSGAPPDPFSEIGQNWGFPTYNWEEMAKDGYQWWKNRFTQLARYFDSFRIDHILGFFRIWQIPLQQVEGTFGFFNPALSIPRSEFLERQIVFNYERLCKPFIQIEILNDLFGKEVKVVTDNFFDKGKKGDIRFKKKFDTQRKVEVYFQKPENKKSIHLQKGLFYLLSNVLFFEVEGSNQMEFHPRIDFLSTSSFKNLDQDIRSRLEVLYNDYFFNRQEDFWRNSAMTKLPAIRKATNMLICGEDLGMVPDCVPGVMEELKILTLEIQRMSKNPRTEFLQEEDIPYLSVASPSTHDMSPIRLWWEEMEEGQRQRFYEGELHGNGIAPNICSPEIAKRILQQHLQWRSMWIVFPLQEILAMSEKWRRKNAQEERINIPANPKHYWRFRFHLTLEELLGAADLNTELKRMILVSGR